MLSRSFKRLLVEPQWPLSLPPAFLLPVSTRAWLNTVSRQPESNPMPEPLKVSISSQNPLITRTAIRRNGAPEPSQKTSSPLRNRKLKTPKVHTNPLTLSDNVRALLPLLRAQQPHYITVHIHGKSYLVTQGDTVRLPFLMPDALPGDVLRLDCATVIGSRDYTMKAGPADTVASTREEAVGSADKEINPSLTKGQIQRLDEKRRRKAGYLDDRLFVCRAVVTGIESEPMRVMEKTKPRNRHTRHVLSKHRYTCLRITEVALRSLDDLESSGVDTFDLSSSDIVVEASEKAPGDS